MEKLFRCVNSCHIGMDTELSLQHMVSLAASMPDAEPFSLKLKEGRCSKRIVQTSADVGRYPKPQRWRALHISQKIQNKDCIPA